MPCRSPKWALKPSVRSFSTIPIFSPPPSSSPHPRMLQKISIEDNEPSRCNSGIRLPFPLFFFCWLPVAFLPKQREFENQILVSPSPSKEVCDLLPPLQLKPRFGRPRPPRKPFTYLLRLVAPPTPPALGTCSNSPPPRKWTIIFPSDPSGHPDTYSGSNALPHLRLYFDRAVWRPPHPVHPSHFALSSSALSCLLPSSHAIGDCYLVEIQSVECPPSGFPDRFSFSSRGERE